MKKFLFLAAFLLAGITHAQLKPGITGGLNFANFANADAGSSNTRTAFAFGIFFERQDFQICSFHPEILYTMKGATYSTLYMGKKVTAAMQLNYFEFPLLWKIKIPSEGMLSPHILAGPTLGILLNSKMRVTGDSTVTDVGTGDLKNYDFGLILGCGFSFPCHSGILNVDLRYEIGLQSFDDSSSGSEIKNSVLSLMLGYRF
jgi:hypothetical protein